MFTLSQLPGEDLCKETSRERIEPQDLVINVKQLHVTFFR